MGDTSKTLGKANPAATTWTLVFQATAAVVTTFSLRVVNRNAAAVKVRIGIVPSSWSSGAPGNDEFIEFDRALNGTDSIEFTGLTLTAGEKVIVHADTANVTFRAYGIESA